MTGALSGQQCPACGKAKAILLEQERDIPYFGKTYVFSLTCDACKFRKTDVEAAEHRQPTKYVLEINDEQDAMIRIVKSSAATVKILHVTTMTPGEASNGFVTNVEGLLQKFKTQIAFLEQETEDEVAKKKARKLLKKLNRALMGQDKLKLIIEDPTGNSAIISEKAVLTPLKK